VLVRESSRLRKKGAGKIGDPLYSQSTPNLPPKMNSRSILLATICTTATLATALGEKAADLKPQLIKPGAVLVEESFGGPALGAEWTVAKGDWQPRDGALVVREKKEDKHPAVLGFGKPHRDSALRCAFKFDGAKMLGLSLNSVKGGHLFRVTFTPQGVSLNKDKDKKDPQSKGVVLAKADGNFADGKWHTVLLEMKGAEVVVQTDGGVTLKGSDPALDVEKTGYRLVMSGESLLVDDVKVWASAP